MITLSEHYRTIADKSQLIGLKVYDVVNECFVYIKEVEGGLWCGKSKNDELGHFYSMSRLLIDTNIEVDIEV